jgi:hypothetical protein
MGILDLFSGKRKPCVRMHAQLVADALKVGQFDAFYVSEAELKANASLMYAYTDALRVPLHDDKGVFFMWMGKRCRVRERAE